MHIHKADKENEWRKAVEFRSSTWYTERTQEFLRRYDTALVLHDMPKSATLALMKPPVFITSGFTDQLVIIEDHTVSNF